MRAFLVLAALLAAGSQVLVRRVPPTLLSLSPNSGAVGASVVITGRDFGANQEATFVLVNGVAATATAWSATSVTITIPTTTTGNVTMSRGGLTSNALTFTVTSSSDGFTGTVRNVTCSGSITAAIQAAIDASSDLDVVNIGSGSCTAGTISWTNKNIKVMGQGIGVTTVTGLNWDVSAGTKAAFRISGMTVGANTSFISANPSTTGVKGWRVDHIDWTSATCGEHIALQLNANTWGLIDHSSFTYMGNAIFQSSYASTGIETSPVDDDGLPGLGGLAWGMALNYGTDEAVYVEDNTFTLADGCFYGINDGFYGSRSVWRFNTITNAYKQNHAARSHERGGNAKSEIYNNDFNATDSNWARAIHLRSGTAMIFANRLHGFFVTMQGDDYRSDGGSDGGASSSAPYSLCPNATFDSAGTLGYPCLDQIGRGPSLADAFGAQLSAPVHVWGNGSGSGCATYGSCAGAISFVNAGDAHVTENRDFYNDSQGTSLPGTCTTGQAYWKTDEGEWDSSHSGVDGRGYTCTSTNTWTVKYGDNLTGMPLAHPHPNVKP